MHKCVQLYCADARNVFIYMYLFIMSVRHDLNMCATALYHPLIPQSCPETYIESLKLMMISKTEKQVLVHILVITLIKICIHSVSITKSRIKRNNWFYLLYMYTKAGIAYLGRASKYRLIPRQNPLITMQ